MTRWERVRMNAAGWESPLEFERDVAPMPEPTGDQVLIQVDACGICYRDLIDRAGRFPFLRLPITPGHEAAGRVLAVGPEVSEWQPGDVVGTMHRDASGQCRQCQAGETSLCDSAAWVLGILADGGYASHLIAPESCFYRLPASLDPAEAAVLQCTFGTAYRDLVTLGRLEAGERVLITGANGGVGAAAVQIAHRLGAEVLAVVRDSRHEPWLRGLGADRVIVDPGGSFHQEADGVDLALEAVGCSTFNSTLRSLRVGGRVVVVGNIVPEKFPLNLGFVITRGLTIVGGSGANRRDMAAVLALHQAQPFQVVIDRRLPLSRAEEGQRLVREGGLQGRVVLLPSDAAAE